ncbi:MAG: hypothetical protein PHY72_02280 [Candidatus Pacebacteria bacterium]|nr:hypothetical protein [Candidatus Paceibacterota bacterium]
MSTAKQKIKIDIAVFIAFLILVIFLGIIPLSSQLSFDSKNLATKKSALSFLESQIKALSDFQNSSLEYQQKINKLDSSFVSQEAPIEFIEFLEQEALNQGLKISLSSAERVSEQKGSRLTMGFMATLTGGFPNILAFLKKVEGSPWLIKVEQVDVSRISANNKLYGAEDAQIGQVILNLSFKTFSNYLSPAQ